MFWSVKENLGEFVENLLRALWNIGERLGAFGSVWERLGVFGLGAFGRVYESLGAFGNKISGLNLIELCPGA